MPEKAPVQNFSVHDLLGRDVLRTSVLHDHTFQISDHLNIVDSQGRGRAQHVPTDTRRSVLPAQLPGTACPLLEWGDDTIRATGVLKIVGMVLVDKDSMKRYDDKIDIFMKGNSGINEFCLSARIIVEKFILASAERNLTLSYDSFRVWMDANPNLVA